MSKRQPCPIFPSFAEIRQVVFGNTETNSRASGSSCGSLCACVDKSLQDGSCPVLIHPSIHPSIHPFIHFPYWSSFRGWTGAGAHPSGHRVGNWVQVSSVLHMETHNQSHRKSILLITTIPPFSFQRYFLSKFNTFMNWADIVVWLLLYIRPPANICFTFKSWPSVPMLSYLSQTICLHFE